VFFLVQLILAYDEVTIDPQLRPLESGFERLSPSLDISSPFFVLAVLFVLFDIELILLIPYIFIKSYRLYFLISGLVIFVIILITLLIE